LLSQRGDDVSPAGDKKLSRENVMATKFVTEGVTFSVHLRRASNDFAHRRTTT
jgi:hypothetical protein